MQEQKKPRDLDLTTLLANSNRVCGCGKTHWSNVKEVIIASQALDGIAEIVNKYGGSRVFVIADKVTFKVAGEKVGRQLEQAGLEYEFYVFQTENIHLHSATVGEVILNYDANCDLIMAVGTGTIGDLGKIVASVADKPFISVATAPSMDGFASSTSSVILNGTKTSINTCAPTAIVADLNVLCNAPFSLLKAGLGDMLAKYISVCEWRISHVITGEYYCQEIASLIRNSVSDCVSSIDGLRRRKPESVEILFKSLVMSGIAMSFAGLSRPASGVEHYFSHLWDMRAIEQQSDAHFHGIQCGLATLFSLKIYDLIKKTSPDKKHALDFVKGFNLADWNNQLNRFLGTSAAGLIEKEKQEGKYDQAKHGERLDQIIQNWDLILQIISEELPTKDQLLGVLKDMDLSLMPQELGLTAEEVRDTFLATKDIRDKYVASRLVWDLGVIDEVAEQFLVALA